MNSQFQLNIEGFSESDSALNAAIEKLALAEAAEDRGAIFTRREVAEFILDLVGYTSDRSLHSIRILEPSFGGGDFLFPIVDRLLKSWKPFQLKGAKAEDLFDCIRAVELHRESFTKAHKTLVEQLRASEISKKNSEEIAAHWLISGDYLLTKLDGRFDVVVGNPPYLRQEMIPEVLLTEYRRRYSTIYDRADLYVPFIERSLQLLNEKGILGFICADRWMKNRYGGPLRSLVARDFHLKIHVDMTGTPAFHSEVSAYPAITVIGREKSGATRIAHRPQINTQYLKQLANALTHAHSAEVNVLELTEVASGAEPWILKDQGHLALVRRLERDYPLLEDAGCKVGIGVATGADKEFIGKLDDLDVEESRKIPLVMTKDITKGFIEWRGFGVINPFNDASGLVDLALYPKLRAFLEGRKERIARRHCAQKDLNGWYRTIDRITPSLTFTPKLLIPDIKGSANIVFDEGKYYPHHNLYFITAKEWDLKALQAILLSNIARLFVATYSTQMRGGFLRYQAQYLRRIRVPKWNDVSPALRSSLIAAAENRDLAACNEMAIELYRLSEAERAELRGME